ncbi:MAG: hypothetical protein R3Y59_03745 [bacterium]
MSRFSIILLLALLLNSCTYKTTTTIQNNNINNKPIVVGGYSSPTTISTEIREMFDKAILQIDTLTNIIPHTVSTQIVAGTNYKFECTAISSNGEEVKGEIVIFRPLPHTNKEPEVTSVRF